MLTDTDEKDASLSKAKGGAARAESLSPERRKEIAELAANERWHSNTVRATHGSSNHPLKIGDLEIPCYVLEDGRRILYQGGMVKAIGISAGGHPKKGGDRLVRFTSQNALSPFINNDIKGMIANPICFKTQKGQRAYGYEATLLTDICDAVLEARKAGLLSKQQEHVGIQAEMLMRGLARTGIIALVDEATGYQNDRDKRALQAILDAFLKKELAAWAKRFPDGFYKEMFRLKGWDWNPATTAKPAIVGRYTIDLVYDRLAPQLVAELEKLNPKDENGKRKSKHHQWLSDEVGHPALAQHLHAITGFMRVSDSWDQMLMLVDRAFPKQSKNSAIHQGTAS